MATAGDAVSTDWSRAFPARLASDVASVVSQLPAAMHPTTSHTIDSERHPRGISVDGRPLQIPYRQYFGHLRPDECVRLTGVELGVAACIYSRHHDGYLRHAWLQSLLAFDDPSVSPYVVQLVGEYVVEIVEAIAASSGDSPAFVQAARFAKENPAFIELTDARARSYWRAYYTYSYASFAQTPWKEILHLWSTIAGDDST